jgi:hypothetical protein
LPGRVSLWDTETGARTMVLVQCRLAVQPLTQVANGAQRTKTSHLQPLTQVAPGPAVEDEPLLLTLTFIIRRRLHGRPHSAMQPVEGRATSGPLLVTNRQ